MNKNKRFVIIFHITPALIITAFSLLYPLCYSIYLAFTRFRLLDLGRKNPQFIGINNFSLLLHDMQFLQVLQATSIVILGVLLCEVPLALLFALLTRRSLPGVRIFRTIYMLPFLLSPVVVGVIWRYMYDYNFGIINYLLHLLGFTAVPWLSNELYARIAIVITHVWQWTPFLYLIFLAGLQNIPTEIYEAAAIDGATAWQRAVCIELPMLKTIIGLGIVLRLIDALNTLVVPMIMTGGGPGLSTEVIALHIYKRAFIAYQLGEANAVAVFLLVKLIILSTFVMIVFKARRRESV